MFSEVPAEYFRLSSDSSNVASSNLTSVEERDKFPCASLVDDELCPRSSAGVTAAVSSVPEIVSSASAGDSPEFNVDGSTSALDVDGRDTSSSLLIATDSSILRFS